MNWLSTADNIIVSLAAMTGMILGIFNFVKDRSEMRRDIRVSLTLNPPGWRPGFVGGVVLTATNPGHTTVLLEEAGLLLPNGDRVEYRPIRLGAITFFSTSSPGGNAPPPPEDNHTFPYHLHPGENHSIQNSFNEVADPLRQLGLVGMVQIRGYYEDALGTIYKSKPISVNTDRWGLNPVDPPHRHARVAAQREMLDEHDGGEPTTKERQAE